MTVTLQEALKAHATLVNRLANLLEDDEDIAFTAEDDLIVDAYLFTLSSAA